MTLAYAILSLIIGFPLPEKSSSGFFCIQVVQNLVKETEGISQEMLAALLSKLRGSIQLPECLRVVAHLRRLAQFSESKLRLM